MANFQFSSTINFEVNLDENNIPEKMKWSAQDGGVDNEETQAILLSFWDTKTQETLKIDLWVKEMPVDQMKKFFHQTLVALSQTFYKATQDEKMTSSMQDFCDHFAEKLGLKDEDSVMAAMGSLQLTAIE